MTLTALVMLLIRASLFVKEDACNSLILDNARELAESESPAPSLIEFTIKISEIILVYI